MVVRVAALCALVACSSPSKPAPVPAKAAAPEPAATWTDCDQADERPEVPYRLRFADQRARDAAEIMDDQSRDIVERYATAEDVLVRALLDDPYSLEAHRQLIGLYAVTRRTYCVEILLRRVVRLYSVPRYSGDAERIVRALEMDKRLRSLARIEPIISSMESMGAGLEPLDPPVVLPVDPAQLRLRLLPALAAVPKVVDPAEAARTPLVVETTGPRPRRRAAAARLRATVIEARPDANGTSVVIDRGSDSGVTMTTRGALMRPDGRPLPDGDLTITAVRARESTARVRAPLANVLGARTANLELVR